MPAKLSTVQFIEKSKSVHGQKYDYEKSIYTKNCDPIEIICPEHGSFFQTASSHMLGFGCAQCKNEKTRRRCTMTQQEFISKANEVHGNMYDYSRTKYVKTNVKVEIICPIHGGFFQKPNSHISNKSGCPKCAGKQLTTTDFIGKLKDRHGDTYGYEKVIYTHIKEPILINCKSHGYFKQTAESHMVGRGCQKCWHESYSSKNEKEIADFIETLGVKVNRNDRDVLSGLEIDIYMPDLKLGIEYNGRYWHSDRFQKNKRNHQFKHVAANRAGIRLITIWDFDWELKKQQFTNLIINAIGKNTGDKINARDCLIQKISSLDATRFHQKNHIQGGCRGAILDIALLYKNDIVGVMSFTKGGSRRGLAGNDEWELARYSTSEIVRGGASKLFKFFLKTSEPKKVWSFSDNQHFSGETYNKLNFQNDGQINPDYRVVHPQKPISWHKSLWQRKSIPKRLIEIGSNDTYDPKTDTRTEHQMQDSENMLRVWDSGKTRWLFINPTL